MAGIKFFTGGNFFMSSKYVAVIDQGTTSTRCILFSKNDSGNRA